MCDQISDAVLDAYLKEDPDSRVACGNKIPNNQLVISADVIDVNVHYRLVACSLHQLSREQCSTPQSKVAAALRHRTSVV